VGGTLPTKRKVLGSKPGKGKYLCGEHEYWFLSRSELDAIYIFKLFKYYVFISIK
jgi:predicted phosphohydrolase